MNSNKTICFVWIPPFILKIVCLYLMEELTQLVVAFCSIKVLPVSREILNGERSSFVINGTDLCVGISALCISITRLVKIRKRKYTKFLKKEKILFYFTFWETQQSMTDKPSLLLRSPPTWCQKKKQHTDRRWFVSSKIFECAFSQLNIISNTNTTNLL